MNALFLAWAWLRWTPIRTSILILVGAVILAVPLVTRLLLADAQETLTSRASQTPLVLGPRGSQLDLAMASLYFADNSPPTVSKAQEEAIWESGLGLPIPLHTFYSASGFPIVGTSLDYLEFRKLELDQGRPFAVLGEVVLGSKVAADLALKPGDTLLSSADSLFDLDGSYPLQMSITGVLAPTGTADDEAIFTDVKTAWVIAGIGHGHDDVVGAGIANDQAALAAIKQFQVITPENLDSFHFHGDPAEYPLSSIIVVPNDQRSSTIIKGRFLDTGNPTQLIVPQDVIQGLVDRIFQVAVFVDIAAALAGVSALLAMSLALYLSWSLRAKEVALAGKIGASRWTILRLAASEIAILVACALLLASAIAWLFQLNSGLILEQITTA